MFWNRNGQGHPVASQSSAKWHKGAQICIMRRNTGTRESSRSPTLALLDTWECMWASNFIACWTPNLVSVLHHFLLNNIYQFYLARLCTAACACQSCMYSCKSGQDVCIYACSNNTCPSCKYVCLVCKSKKEMQDLICKIKILHKLESARMSPSFLQGYLQVWVQGRAWLCKKAANFFACVAVFARSGRCMHTHTYPSITHRHLPHTKIGRASCRERV